MRKKREIENLDTVAIGLQFPLANHPFERYQSRLREIIHANCGGIIAHTLEYDPYEQLFYVTVSFGGQLLPKINRDDEDVADNASTTIRCVVEISPHKPLTPQIIKIGEAQEAIAKRHDQLGDLLLLLKTGTLSGIGKP